MYKYKNLQQIQQNKVNSSKKMQIINHYKNQVNKSIQTLHEQNILPHDQQQQISTQQTSLSSSSITSPSSQYLPNTTSPSQTNPYAATTKPQTFPKSPTKCIVCHKSQPKYRCPQCLVSYCSSGHYKSHNMFCSEGFFKRQVEGEMKLLKATKQQKEKMRQMLKEDKDIKGEETEVSSSKVSEERLIHLLEVIEQCQKDGKQLDEQILKLTEDQRKHFDLFLEQMQSSQLPTFNKQNLESSLQQQKPLLQSLSQPYWLIPDGLDYYFMQDIEIEEFASSTHLELIIYRESMAKKYREEIKNLSQLIKGKPSHLVREDILQYMVVWVLVNLSWGSQLKEKEAIHDVFESLFVKQLAKDIIEKGIDDKQTGSYLLARLKQNIAAIKSNETRNLLNSWYEANTISSCKLIVKNKFLLVETFLRLLQFFQSIEREVCSSEKVSKKKLHQVIKHVKKLEFLLSYLKEEISFRQNSFSDKPKQDLFRYLKRILTQQQNDLLARKQQQKYVNNQRSCFQQIQKHGILIKQ